MAYIPEHHKKYGLLPYCTAHGGEVFEYPGGLLNKIDAHLPQADHLDPYGYSSYEEYDSEIDRVMKKYAHQEDLCALLCRYKSEIYEGGIGSPFSYFDTCLPVVLRFFPNFSKVKFLFFRSN